MSHARALEKVEGDIPNHKVVPDKPRFTDVRMQRDANRGTRSNDIIPLSFPGKVKTQSLLPKKCSKTNLPECAILDEVKEAQKWNLSNVPEYYSLERSSILIRGTSLQQLVTRMSGFLLKKSIKCTYQSESARIICSTENDSLKFIVQLWRGGETQEEGSGIILEVQRRRGCSIEMKNIRVDLFRTLLTAALKKGPVRISNASRTSQYRKQTMSMPRLSR